MKNILIGFIFIFLDFNLNLGNSKIGLIPDFIGYITMISGLDELAGESSLFMKLKPYATGMAVYSFILYILDLIGMSVSLGSLTFILAIVSTAVSLYISYNIVMGVIEMEGKYNTSLNGDSLKSTWTLLAVFNILIFMSLLIPAVSIILILISIIIVICFLLAFNNSKNLYYEKVENN